MPDESVLLGELADEFTAQVRAGRAPVIEDYARSHPELAERIRRLFPTLLMLEGLAVGGQAQDTAEGQTGSHLAAGATFGNYRIVRELGRGGMGVVYEAIHLLLDKPVALKVLPLHGSRSPSQLERFFREAKTAAALHHTNIVPVFDISQAHGTPYYAMQLIDGRGLDRGLQTEAVPAPAPTADLAATEDHDASPSPPASGGEGRGEGGPVPDKASTPSPPTPLPRSGGEGRRASDRRLFSRIANLGIQAAEALAYAHERGVIHRDIKPSNLLLDKQGVLWITDFGLARRLDDAPGLTHSGAILGTPRYMSPEQAEAAKRPIDHRTDIYSLGATLYELLTCRPAFDGKTPHEVVSQIISRDPVPPRRLNPAVPRDLETIVQKAMAKRPEDRYQTGAEMAEDLRRWQRVEPIQARRIGPIGRTTRWCRRNPRLAGALAVIFAITIGYSILLQLQWHETLRVYKREQEANDGLRAKEAEVRNRFVRQLVSNGQRLLDQENAFGAGLWFAEALKVDSEGAADEEMHRLRIGSVLQSRPRLVHCWFHKDYVSRSAFSPDGKRALTICANELRLWDVETGAPICPPLAQPHHVWNAWFSPDSTKVLALTLPGNLPGGDAPYEGDARVYDTATGKLLFPPLKLIKPHGWVGSFSPDGSQFLVAAGKQVQGFDATTGQPKLSPLDHAENVAQAVFCPLGKRILTCTQFWTNEGTPQTRLWNAATGQPITPPLKGMTATAQHAFSPDGKRFVVFEPEQRREGYLLQPRKVTIYDSDTGEQQGGYERQGLMRAAAFSPDGRFLVMAYNPFEFKQAGFWLVDPNTFESLPEKTVFKVYDLKTGLPLADREVLGKDAEFTFSPDSRRLLASGRQFRLWDLAGGTQVLGAEDLDAQDPARSAHFTRFSPCGRWLLGFGGSDADQGQVILFDMLERQSVWLNIPHRHGTLTAEFSPDGRYLLTHSHDGTARVWDLAGMGPAVFPFPAELHDGVPHIVPSPNGRLLAFAFGNSAISQDRGGAEPRGGIRFWDTINRRATGPTITRPARIDRLAFHPDSTRLAGVTQFGEAVVWDVSSGDVLFSMGDRELSAHRYEGKSVRQVAFTRDGARLITVMSDGSLRSWDAKNGQPLAVLPFQNRFPRAVLSADGWRLFASINDEVGEIYDVNSCALLQRLPRLTGGIQRAGFSDDSRRLMVRSNDSLARIWDVESGQLLAPVMHGVDDASFSPDGALLLAARGGFTRVWDAAKGEPITGNMHMVNLVQAANRDSGIGFGADSRTLIASALNALRVWELRPDTLPAEDLVRLAQVLSGHRIDPVGGYTPLHREELELAWRQFQKSSRPEERRASSAQARQWREREAWEAEREAEDLQAQRRSEDVARVSSAELAHWHAAEFHLNQLIALDPKEGAYRTRRAKARVATDRLKDALADYTEAMQLGNADGNAFHARSLLHHKLGNQAQAAEDFARAIELGLSQNEADAEWQWQAVVVGLTRYMERKPNDPSLHIKRADAHMELEDWTAAVADYSRAIELGVNKDYYQVWEMRGVAYQQLKHFDKAIADYTKAIEIRPKWGDNYDTRGECHAELKQFDQADADFRKAMECGDDEATFWYHHALLRLALGDRLGYLERLRLLREHYKEPIYYGAIANLAWAHALVPDVVTDWQPFTELLKNGQENLDGHKRTDFPFTRTRGAVLYRAGKYDEAIAFLRQAAELQSDPQPITAWLFLAMTYQRQGNLEEAKKWLEQAEAVKRNDLSWANRTPVDILLKEAKGVVK